MSDKETQKEIKHLGYANSWQETPRVVSECAHQKETVDFGRCQRSVTCRVCGYTYFVDSSD